MTGPAIDAAGTSQGSTAPVTRELARASVYRLLGRALAYPTGDLVVDLTPLAGVLSVAPAVPVSVHAAFEELAVAARGADASALAGEHVFLFDRQVRCPPHEGAYGDPTLAGPAAQLADVAGFYAAFGVEPSALRPDMEDHIATELEFMSVLALKEAYAIAQDDADGAAVIRAAQVAFLGDHLGRWGEAFAARLAATTTLPYYGATARLLGAWLAADLDALDVKPRRLSSLADPGPLGADTFTCPMAEPEPDLPTPTEENHRWTRTSTPVEPSCSCWSSSPSSPSCGPTCT
jgi:TorA maturation chaperone TorD